MTVYTGSIARALASIAKKGDVCTWRQYTVIDGDVPWDEASGIPEFVDYPVKIVFLPYSASLSRMTFSQTDGDVTRYTSYGLMGAVAFTPACRDMVIRSSGQTLKPQGLDLLRPANEDILWTIGFNG